MRSTIALLFVAFAALLGAGCATDPWGSREEDLQAIYDPFLPSNAVTFFVSIDAASIPEWHVRDRAGVVLASRELRVAKDRREVLVLRADRDCAVQIPSMRIDASIVPGRPTVVWFVPTVVGSYEVRVHAGFDRFDGTLRVVEPKTP